VPLRSASSRRAIGQPFSHLTAMGYNVYITRRKNWFAEDGPEISLKEWVDLVRADDEMRLDGYAEATTGSGDVIRVKDESMAVWLKYSKHEANGNMAWIWHFQGNIVAKNPDEEILCKMWRVAQATSAKVQGEESELYGSDGRLLQEASVLGDARKSANKPWWRFW
jgi:hypothetical protein